MAPKQTTPFDNYNAEDLIRSLENISDASREQVLLLGKFLEQNKDLLSSNNLGKIKKAVESLTKVSDRILNTASQGRKVGKNSADEIDKIIITLKNVLGQSKSASVKGLTNKIIQLQKDVEEQKRKNIEAEERLARRDEKLKNRAIYERKEEERKVKKWGDHQKELEANLREEERLREKQFREEQKLIKEKEKANKAEMRAADKALKEEERQGEKKAQEFKKYKDKALTGFSNTLSPIGGDVSRLATYVGMGQLNNLMGNSPVSRMITGIGALMAPGVGSFLGETFKMVLQNKMLAKTVSKEVAKVAGQGIGSTIAADATQVVAAGAGAGIASKLGKVMGSGIGRTVTGVAGGYNLYQGIKNNDAISTGAGAIGIAATVAAILAPEFAIIAGVIAAIASLIPGIRDMVKGINNTLFPNVPHDMGNYVSSRNGKAISTKRQPADDFANEPVIRKSSLEKLKGGKYWSVAGMNSDKPIAKQGMSSAMDLISSEYYKSTGNRLVVTGAMGTIGGPHGRGVNGTSHYTGNKLDVVAIDKNGKQVRVNANTMSAIQSKYSGIFSMGTAGLEDTGTANQHYDFKISDEYLRGLHNKNAKVVKPVTSNSKNLFGEDDTIRLKNGAPYKSSNSSVSTSVVNGFNDDDYTGHKKFLNALVSGVGVLA